MSARRFFFLRRNVRFEMNRFVFVLTAVFFFFPNESCEKLASPMIRSSSGGDCLPSAEYRSHCHKYWTELLGFLKKKKTADHHHFGSCHDHLDECHAPSFQLASALFSNMFPKVFLVVEIISLKFFIYLLFFRRRKCQIKEFLKRTASSERLPVQRTERQNWNAIVFLNLFCLFLNNKNSMTPSEVANKRKSLFLVQCCLYLTISQHLLIWKWKRTIAETANRFSSSIVKITQYLSSRHFIFHFFKWSVPCGRNGARSADDYRCVICFWFRRMRILFGRHLPPIVFQFKFNDPLSSWLIGCIIDAISVGYEKNTAQVERK